jgi:hypothetical protein
MRMQQHAKLFMALTGLGLAVVVSVAVAAAPQSPTPPGDPITNLLAEVHALRLAMEQSATVGPRIQVTLARLGFQEQRTAHLSTTLDAVRRQIADESLQGQKLATELENVEKSLQTETDEKVKRETLDMQAALKRNLSNHSAREQQLRVRENDAAQMLSSEQARWIELSARLDELERLLAPPVR